MGFGVVPWNVIVCCTYSSLIRIQFSSISQVYGLEKTENQNLQLSSDWLEVKSGIHRFNDVS